MRSAELPSVGTGTSRSAEAYVARAAAEAYDNGGSGGQIPSSTSYISPTAPPVLLSNNTVTSAPTQAQAGAEHMFRRMSEHMVGSILFQAQGGADGASGAPDSAAGPAPTARDCAPPSNNTNSHDRNDADGGAGHRLPGCPDDPPATN